MVDSRAVIDDGSTTHVLLNNKYRFLLPAINMFLQQPTPQQEDNLVASFPSLTLVYVIIIIHNAHTPTLTCT